MKEKIKYIKEKKVEMGIALLSFLCISIFNTIYLKEILNSITYNIPIYNKGWIYGIIIQAIGMILFITTLFIFSNNKGSRKLTINLIMVLIIKVGFIFITAICMGVLAVFISKKYTDLEQVKSLIDVSSQVVNIFVNALISTILSNVVINNKILTGIKINSFIKILMFFVIIFSMQVVLKRCTDIWAIDIFRAITLSILNFITLISSFYIFDKESSKESVIDESKE